MPTTPLSPASIQFHKGRPVIAIQGKPLPFVAYSPIDQARATASIERFFAHDLTVYFLNLPRGIAPPGIDDWLSFPFWVGDTIEPRQMRELATPSLQEQAEFILKGCPNARFIIRFGPHEPGDWRAIHPDELFVTEEGDRREEPSLASALYARDSGRFIEAVIRFSESHTWSEQILGYWTGQRVEGTHAPVSAGWVYDHSPVMKKRWARFLREKYGSDAALQTAWGQAEVCCDSALIPRDRLRGTIPEVEELHFWPCPQSNRPFRDYLELSGRLYQEIFHAQVAAHHRAMPEGRIFLLDTLKQGLQGWHQRGFFGETSSWPMAYHDMLAPGGSIEAGALLDSPEFDGLITPHDYHARGLGGVYEPEGAADSAILRGKIFLCEMDTRTTSGRDPIAPARDAQEFATLTWRNLGAGLARGLHSYWMDVFEDWFATPEIHAVIHRQVEVLHEAIDWPHEDVPGIAVILDDTATLDTNGDGRYANEAILWEQKCGLARCGVPFRTYLLEDLEKPNFPRHRVFYFPNLFRVDKARLELLRRTVFKKNHVVLWGPGSGITDGKTVDAAHATRLTGFSFSLIPANYPRRVLITDFTHPITRRLDEGQILGGPLAYGPVLLPTSGQPLGMAWTKTGQNAYGLVVEERHTDSGSWTSVFTTVVQLPAQFWRGLAEHAGAHVYCQSNDLVMADRYTVALHSIRSGAKSLALPEPCRVFDIITGERVAESTTQVEFVMTAPATRLFRLEPHS